MHPYNVKQIEQRLKRKRQLESQLRTMTVKQLAEKLGITHQAIYKAMKWPPLH